LLNRLLIGVSEMNCIFAQSGSNSCQEGLQVLSFS